MENVGLSYGLGTSSITSLKEFIVRSRKRETRRQTTSIEALKGISLKVDAGERVGIVGLNGSGKSSLLKLVSGIMKPSQGTIEIKGTVQPLIELGAGFNGEFTGRQNIYLNGAMLGFSKAEIRNREASIIDFCELEEDIDRPVKGYSSGMVARLAFSVATSIRPEILVLDEMLSVGDISFVDKARQRMQEIIDTAKILIIVSHNLDLIGSLCDRVLFLQRGRLVADGEPKSVIPYYRETAGS